MRESYITEGEYIRTDSINLVVRMYLEKDRASLLKLSELHYGDKDLATDNYSDWLSQGTPGGKYPDCRL